MIPCKNNFFITILLLTLHFPLFCQTNFVDDYNLSNPIDYRTDTSQQLVIEKHQNFLQDAIARKDSLQIVYGYLFLTYDHLSYQNFKLAAEVIIEAENFVNSSNNEVWKGRVLRTKGNLQFQLKNYEDAIHVFEDAYLSSAKGKDSNNLAIILEQLGAVHSDLGQTQKALQYYDLSLPLIKIYGDSFNLSVATNNIGTIYSKIGDHQKAMDYFQNSLQINIKIKNEYKATLSRINIADEFVKLGQIDTAIIVYNDLIIFLENKNWPTLLSYNYEGLANAFIQKNDWQKAFYYKERYSRMEDSIIGKSIQLKVADLETQNVKNLREIENNKYQLTLEKNKRKLVRNNLVFLIAILILLFAVGLLFQQKKNVASQLRQNKEGLTNLTKTLASKNALIKEKEEKIIALKRELNQDVVNPETEIAITEELENIYDLNILTFEDWQIFKNYFKKVFPGFIIKVKNFRSDITEGEMRLFLLIKLKLTRMEIASVLGISADSVKKNRSRLRKRLALNKELPLDKFVQNFK